MHALWLNRLVGLASFGMAFFCLYLALSLLGERLLTDHLVSKLNNKGIESSWDRIEWSGRGICAHLARVRVPKAQLVVEANRICTRLSLKSQWPMLSVDDLLVDQPKIWLRIETSQKASFPDIMAETDHFKKTLVEGHYSQLDQALSRSLSLWRSFNIYLTKLGEQVIEIQGAEVYLAFPQYTRPLPVSLSSIGFDLNLSMTGGDGALKLGHLGQTVLFRFIPRQLELRSPLRVVSQDMEITINQGARIIDQRSFTEGDQLQVDGQLHLKRSLHESTVLPLQIDFKLHHYKRSTEHALELSLLNSSFDSGAKKSGRLNALFKKFELEIRRDKDEIKPLFINFKQVNLHSLIAVAGVDILPMSIGGSLSGMLSLNSGASSDQGKITYKLKAQKPQLKMMGLPNMSWPSMSLNGQFEYGKEMYGGHLQALSRLNVKNNQIILETYKTTKVQANLSTSIVLDQGSEVRSFTFNSIQSFDLTLEMDKTPCQDLFDVIPHTVLGSISSAHLSGHSNPKLTFKFQKPSANAKATHPPSKLRLVGLLRRCRFEEMNMKLSSSSRVKLRGSRALLRDVNWLNEAFTLRVDPKFTKGAKVTIGPMSKHFVSYDELPGYIGGAMYLTEETGFWRGGAFSPTLLNRAINTNLSKGSFVYGGSTITQQLVKNLFLDREKTLARKIREALISARVIDTVSKRRVLELYLNMIEFAPQVYGIQAAAQYYFQKDARALSPEEAIFLAMLKVAPHRGPKWIKRGTSPTFTWWRQRMVQVFKRLVHEGLITAKRAKGAAPFVLKWTEGKYLGSTPMSSEKE